MVMQTAVRVISLAHSARRDCFHRPAESLGLDWSFMDASTGLIDDVAYDPLLSYRHMSRQLATGEIGCYCSHVRLWRELLSSQATQLIVMEDDVYADWDFVAAYAEVDWSKAGIDYLKFFIKRPAAFRMVRWHYPMHDRHLVEYTSLALGTGAYLITRKAAERFERAARVISRPVDVQIDRAWATGIPVLSVFPYIAMELSLPSSLLARERSDISAMRRLDYLAHRVIEVARVKAYPFLSRPPQPGHLEAPPSNPVRAAAVGEPGS
jgi:glycosyl transferase family 25